MLTSLVMVGNGIRIFIKISNVFIGGCQVNAGSLNRTILVRAVVDALETENRSGFAGGYFRSVIFDWTPPDASQFDEEPDVELLQIVR